LSSLQRKMEIIENDTLAGDVVALMR
jgi:hypothetical protein